MGQLQGALKIMEAQVALCQPQLRREPVRSQFGTAGEGARGLALVSSPEKSVAGREKKTRFIHWAIRSQDLCPAGVFRKQIGKVAFQGGRIEPAGVAGPTASIILEVDLGGEISRVEFERALKPNLRLAPSPEPLHLHSQLIQRFGI